MLKESIELSTTLVLSRQRLLNGSKWLFIASFISILSSCALFRPAPRSIPPEPGVEVPTEAKPKEEPVAKEETVVSNIALLLPFQLDQIRNHSPSRADVSRAEIPLDFYQGFKLALDQLAEQGNNFRLNVLDTRDNVSETSRLALSAEIQSADLIVGPIFPKEISAFAASAKLGYSLQVSPLAASDPTSFDIENLVTLATPIVQHAEGVAAFLNKQARASDQIIFYETNDNETRRYLKPLKERLQEQSRAQIIEVSSLEDLEDALSLGGNNIVVAASVNKYVVDALMVSLLSQRDEMGYKVQLVGHPSWIKSSFLAENLKQLNTLIPGSYYVNPGSSMVKRFERQYLSQYRLDPSEFAYKGFDTGYFFGSLLIKYGPDFPKYLLKERYKGLQTNYNFQQLPNAGYVNTFIQILQFNGDQYLPR